MWGPAPNLGRCTPCQGQQEGARPSPTLAQTEQTPRGQGAGLGRHASPAGRGAVRHPRPQQSPGRRPRAPTRHCSEGRPSHDLLLSGQSRPLLAPSAPHTQGGRSVTPKEPLPSTQATVCQKPSVKHGKLSTCVGRWLVCPASRAALGRRAPDSPSCGTHGDDSCGGRRRPGGLGFRLDGGARWQTFMLRPGAPLSRGELPEMRVRSAPTATPAHRSENSSDTGPWCPQGARLGGTHLPQLSTRPALTGSCQPAGWRQVRFHGHRSGTPNPGPAPLVRDQQA